jgi:hypothetical protein
MSQPASRSRTNWITLLVVLVGFLLFAYYATVAMTTKDLLWFLEGFGDQPSLIVVYHNGLGTELRPGQPGFNEIAEAVQASLAQGFARLSGIGFSEESLQEAYTQHVTLEVFWQRPIQIHTWFPTGRTTQMLFPITGRHSEVSIVLLGDEGQYRVGAPVLETMEPIRETLRALGFY